MTKFEKQCREVSEKLGIDVMFFYNQTRRKCAEDDGSLHITKGGVRACFNVGNGQSLPPKQQNENTRAVMTELGMADKINDGVLVEEMQDGEEIEPCPHCGRYDR